jgi:carotenoid cleavage dioxygenase
VTDGTLETWDHGEQVSVQEPQFVPRTPDSPEGDGWLLTILNRLDRNHSELAVFDATRLSDGPVARLFIPVRVRATFHGMWVPAETLRTGRFDMQVAA